MITTSRESHSSRARRRQHRAITTRPALPLLRAAHPVPALAVTMLAVLLAASMGVGTRTSVTLLVAVFSGQLVVGWTNDLVDSERDRRVGRGDKPLATGQIAVGLVRSAIGAASVVCVLTSLLCGPAAGLLHLVAVGAALAYNAGLKSTAFSWLPYSLAFGALPAVVGLARDSAALPPWWMVAVGALLGFAAHLLNAMPDLADDAATGVLGLPTGSHPPPSRHWRRCPSSPPPSSPSSAAALPDSQSVRPVGRGAGAGGRRDPHDGKDAVLRGDRHRGSQRRHAPDRMTQRSRGATRRL
ncbi:UbiA family prenyltransferase [Dietzia aerolata]|uniref:UbiA family prenyltransferase n=1 Tax=Dietzia aerolata TaxID=595984 RepID=UPI0036360FD6